MIQVFLTTHNVTNCSLIHSSLQFYIPHCITILFCHLKLLAALISTPVALLGSWGTIPRVPNPLAACCSHAHFPMAPATIGQSHAIVHGDWMAESSQSWTI